MQTNNSTLAYNNNDFICVDYNNFSKNKHNEINSNILWNINSYRKLWVSSLRIALGFQRYLTRKGMMARRIDVILARMGR